MVMSHECNDVRYFSRFTFWRFMIVALMNESCGIWLPQGRHPLGAPTVSDPDECNEQVLPEAFHRCHVV